MISLKGFITREVRAEPITTHLASASGLTYDAFAAVRFPVRSSAVSANRLPLLGTAGIQTQPPGIARRRSAFVSLGHVLLTDQRLGDPASQPPTAQGST